MTKLFKAEIRVSTQTQNKLLLEASTDAVIELAKQQKKRTFLTAKNNKQGKRQIGEKSN